MIGKDASASSVWWYYPRAHDGCKYDSKKVKSALEIAWYVKKECRHDFTKSMFLILIFNMYFHIDTLQFNLDLLLWSQIQAFKKKFYSLIFHSIHVKFCWHVYPFTLCMCSATEAKRGWRSLCRWSFKWAVVSYHVVAGNWSVVLFKSNKCSLRLRCLHCFWEFSVA